MLPNRQPADEQISSFKLKLPTPELERALNIKETLERRSIILEDGPVAIGFDRNFHGNRRWYSDPSNIRYIYLKPTKSCFRQMEFQFSYLPFSGISERC